MSAADELAAFRAGRSVAPAPLELLEVAGPDRERLLHGLTTGEVRKLEPGQTAHGFFTSGQGRILADYRLLALADRFQLLLPGGTAATVAAHLEKYKLASRVELRAQPGAPLFELRSGAAANAILAGGDGEVVAMRDPAARAESYFLLPKATAAEESAAGVRSALDRRGLRVAEAALADLARIEDGELRFGADFGPENFPQETGRESGVSYTKGCFLGQEIVARIHYRGGVQKRPCGLRFDGGRLPAAGAELSLDGRAVGRATSVADSPGFGAIGLGILHQRGAEPGTGLEFEGGVARVVALPFDKIGTEGAAEKTP